MSPAAKSTGSARAALAHSTVTAAHNSMVRTIRVTIPLVQT
jgi:hypothetical protein